MQRRANAADKIVSIDNLYPILSLALALAELDSSRLISVDSIFERVP